jgi:lipopolysaccharide/colanic/teichoic acid biosynthesis glycosyltransferase
MTKRCFDFLSALTILLMLWPILGILALIVRVRLGTAVFFRQQRPGLRGKPFWMYKFRTMTNARDASGQLLPDDQRLTGLGRFLRSTSLDELPELLNVLRGDMSLVGPRPLLMQYLDRYTPEQSRRMEVKPGLTGWAQIHGRNTLTWEEKFSLDVWYVDHCSFALDFQILLLTAWKVIRREGISAADHATMPEFQGSRAGSDASNAIETAPRIAAATTTSVRETPSPDSATPNLDI